MKKRTFWLSLLAAIMVVSCAMPLFLASAEETATVPKTLSVDLFNGDTEAVKLGGGATFATDDEVNVVSMTDTKTWPGGQILLKETKDLSMTKDGRLYIEFRNNDSLTYHWTIVGLALNKGTWTSTAALNGSGEDLGVNSAYTVKSFSLSAVTDADMAQAYGLTLTTSKDQTGANFLIKRVWIEYPNPDYKEDTKPTTEGTYELITEAVTAAQDPSANWQYIATIPSNYDIQKGDKIKIAINFDGNIDATGKALDMWVGEDKIPFANNENYIYSKNAEWEYTFKDSCSGNIKFGIWSTKFDIASATLTIVKHEQEAPVTSYDIFTGITEVGEPVQNSAKTAWTAEYKGSVNGKAVTDGSALAFGTLEDGTY